MDVVNLSITLPATHSVDLQMQNEQHLPHTYINTQNYGAT